MLRGHIRRLFCPVFAVLCVGCVNGPPRRPIGQARDWQTPTAPTAPAAQTSQPPAADNASAQTWQPVKAETQPAERPAGMVSTTSAPAAAAAPAAATSATPPSNDPATKLRALYDRAAQARTGLSQYVARLRRREQIGGKDRPEEVMMLKFRQQPFSVYFKFVGPVARGREVIYVQGQHSGQIHTLAAAGDSIFVSAGQRIALAPDSFLVRSASRHPITEAGIGNLVDQFGRILGAVERGGSQLGSLKYLGPYKRSEYPTALETVEQQVPARCESTMPRGGRRYWFFEPTLGLPVLIVTLDHTGHEVEYYCYDQLQTQVGLTDDDFNPDKLWGRR